MSASTRARLLLAGAIAAEVTATLSLKAALTAPWLYAVVVIGYVAAFALLAATLRTGMALGVAYGMWGASGVVLTALLSAALFGQPLNALMALGFAIIVGGVLCIEFGSQAAHRRRERDTRASPGQPDPDARTRHGGHETDGVVS